MKADKTNSQAKNIQRNLAKFLLNPRKTRLDKIRYTNWASSRIGKDAVQAVIDWRYSKDNAKPQPVATITTQPAPAMDEELQWEIWVAQR